MSQAFGWLVVTGSGTMSGMNASSTPHTALQSSSAASMPSDAQSGALSNASSNASSSPVDAAVADATRPAEIRSEGFERVRAALRLKGHGHEPLWLTTSARSAQEAADALGVSLGQIAKSVVFRCKADESAVLVIAAGDRRVDERKLQVHTGPLGRADADFVKARTGFSIGGVSPLGFAPAGGGMGPRLFIDDSLLRFDIIWAAAGHPNGVFPMTPQELIRLTEAPVIEVVQS